ALEGCGLAKPTLSISSPTASRADTTVDFHISLDCKPARNPTVLLAPVRDGELGNNIYAALTKDQPTATVTITTGTENQLALALVWSTGLANKKAQGNVAYTD
ncbi:MAG: hypothetical protein OXN79_00060, partial [bacterium]|nr:hypothetical protein [bacterium]